MPSLPLFCCCSDTATIDTEQQSEAPTSTISTKPVQQGEAGRPVPMSDAVQRDQAALASTQASPAQIVAAAKTLAPKQAFAAEGPAAEAPAQPVAAPEIADQAVAVAQALAAEASAETIGPEPAAEG